MALSLDHYLRMKKRPSHQSAAPCFARPAKLLCKKRMPVDFLKTIFNRNLLVFVQFLKRCIGVQKQNWHDVDGWGTSHRIWRDGKCQTSAPACSGMCSASKFFTSSINLSFSSSHLGFVPSSSPAATINPSNLQTLYHPPNLSWIPPKIRHLQTSLALLCLFWSIFFPRNCWGDFIISWHSFHPNFRFSWRSRKPQAATTSMHSCAGLPKVFSSVMEA